MSSCSSLFCWNRSAAELAVGAPPDPKKETKTNAMCVKPLPDLEALKVFSSSGFVIIIPHIVFAEDEISGSSP